MTVLVPPDSKQETELQNKSSQTVCKNKRNFQLRLYLGRAFLPDSKAREVIARACEFSSKQVLLYHRVAQFIGSLSWASGLIPLGHLHLRPLQGHFHSLGLTSRKSAVLIGTILPHASLTTPW